MRPGPGHQRGDPRPQPISRTGGLGKSHGPWQGGLGPAPAASNLAETQLTRPCWKGMGHRAVLSYLGVPELSRTIAGDLRVSVFQEPLPDTGLMGAEVWLSVISQETLVPIIPFSSWTPRAPSDGVAFPHGGSERDTCSARRRMGEQGRAGVGTQLSPQARGSVWPPGGSKDRRMLPPHPRPGQPSWETLGHGAPHLLSRTPLFPGMSQTLLSHPLSGWGN